MTIKQRNERNLKVAKFLATPITYSANGKPVYPSLGYTAAEFNLSLAQIFRIKKDLLGLDEMAERHIKPNEL